MINKDIKSKYFPYQKVYTQTAELKSVNQFTYNILTYLMDLPMPHLGYAPIDDNDYPRTRLIKYLYYDDNKPLSHALPTPQEKIALRYNPEKTDSRDMTKKGYRLFLQNQWTEKQLDAQTILKITVGAGMSSMTADKTIRQIYFTVLTNGKYENNVGSTTRSWQIVQAIIESLNGVNMQDMCGGFTYVKDYPIEDNHQNVGRQLIMQAEMIN